MDHRDKIAQRMQESKTLKNNPGRCKDLQKINVNENTQPKS